MSSDGINESPRPWLLGVELRDRDPGDILAVPVASHGWAYAGDLSKLYRAWTGDRVGELDTTTLARLDGAYARRSTCEPACTCAAMFHNLASGTTGWRPLSAEARGWWRRGLLIKPPVVGSGSGRNVSASTLAAGAQTEKR